MRAIGTALVGVALTLSASAAHAQGGPPPVGGRLAGAVLLGEAPLAAADLPADLSSADRLRLLAYQDRWGAFRTRRVVAGNLEAWTRRDRLEREIASVIERDGIERAAHAIAWSDGPYGLDVDIDANAEAAWAERLVREPSNAVAAPYLYAFLASRYRLQFEQAPPDDRPALERLAKKYKTMLERVRNAGDSLLVILADDLDGRPALSAGVARHPRQYLPDT
jgi:hypothetical protein